MGLNIKKLPSYLFVGLYALAATLFLNWMNWEVLPPRAGDVFLIGILVSIVIYASAKPAIYLYLYSLGFMVYALAPQGRYWVVTEADVYRLSSYTATTLVGGAIVRFLRKMSSRAANAFYTDIDIADD
jgi:hypothetical protein